MRHPFSITILSGLIFLAGCAAQEPPATDNTMQQVPITYMNPETLTDSLRRNHLQGIGFMINRIGQSQRVYVSGDDSGPEGTLHNLPIPSGVQAAKNALAARLDVEAKSVLILEAHEKEWPDACLGLGGPAESCAAVVTPGYAVLMTYQGADYRYRTDSRGSAVRAE